MEKRKNNPLQKQAQILGFIDSYFAENCRPPSIREIQKAVDLSSTSLVGYHLQALCDTGEVVRIGDNSRSFLSKSMTTAIQSALDK